MLETIESEAGVYFSVVHSDISRLNFNRQEEVEKYYQQLKSLLATCLDAEIIRIQQNEINNRVATLQTRILLEMTDIIETTHRLYHLYEDFITQQEK